jgi:plastocyanin
MKRAAALAATAAMACATLAAPATTATLRNVKVGDNYFVRDGAARTVTVSRNTRVKWLWRGDAPHNVTVRRGPVRFHSKTMRTGSYSKLMRRAGTYRIVCTIHGASDQSMTLRVRTRR